MRNKLIIGLTALAVVALCATSCNPDAPWSTKDVEITMKAEIVSAGFAEYHFYTNKEAYYYVACEPVQKGVDPTLPANQKQFMTLALDSANTEYIQWRAELLKEGEFNIAPFSSHCLQYGSTHKCFTNLQPGTDYWVYAFAVEPEKIQPAGKLYLETITTSDTSVLDIHFDYRVRGLWDYIYPLETNGHINSHFPYLSATRDSLSLNGMTPEDFFTEWFLNLAKYDLKDDIHYGVYVKKNDGFSSEELFEEGHTYYTAIVSYDGFMGNNVIYKFNWTGDDFEAYFTDEDNIVVFGEDE